MKSHLRLRSDAAAIWSHALLAVDPAISIRRIVRRRGALLRVAEEEFDLADGRRVWVVGAGKAAAPMGQAMESILGKYLTSGFLVTKDAHALPLNRLELAEAGHPLPDERGIAAGAKLSALAKEQIKTGDIVFCLLSGGGSALLVSPAPGIKLQDKLSCTDLLLRAGASIHEINAVRKHLSALKGGGLARLLGGADVISLILSDVVGDPLDTIASGPLVPDPTTYEECLGILQKYGLTRRVPPAVLRRMKAGASGSIGETPKPGDPIFRRCRNVIVANNSHACAAAERQARKLGYRTMVLTTRLEGDTAEAAAFHMSIAEDIVAHQWPLKRPACVISGGETTVKVTGNGRGGRNQEFVLRSARRIARLQAPCVIASLGTDGTDGPTDAAGAWADNTMATRALKFGARYLDESLRNNDSYTLFRRLGNLIVTGPTRTNVMDLHIILIG